MAGDFSPYLAPHESVRWSGRPAQGLMLRASDAILIPFSIMWCGFAIFWESGVVASGAPLFFMLWGVPFVAVGLYFVFGRFFYDAYTRSRTYYALTDRRALILSKVWSEKLTSVELHTLSELHFKPRASGQGTLIFGPDTGHALGWGRRNTEAASPEFFAVEDAKTAYSLIQRIRQPK